jgi:WD40 repeat protein
MRMMWLLGAAGVAAGCLGCNDRLLIDLFVDNGGGQATGGSQGTPPDAGAGGAGGTDGGVGTGGAGGAIAACGPLTFSSTMVLAPAAAGQDYTRCGTLGPEAGWQVTLAPTADHLAARTAAGTVRLLATAPWRELAQLASPLGQLDAEAFSPDGAVLATVSAEMGEVTLWSATDGSFQRSFAGPAASGVDTTASSLAYSSDGGRLATSLGTIIDLAAGTTTNWLTGMPQTFTLADNPENLGFSQAGGGIPFLHFTAGDAQLFVETDFQIGDSPLSTRLELRDPTSGAQVVLYSFYTRGLLGYALSHDGRFIAMGATQEAAGAAGIPLGLTVFDATTGAQTATNSSSTGTVIGFSPDGTQIFTESGQTITAQATTDLHFIGAFTLPAGTTVLGVSPGDDVVASTTSATSWFDPKSGEVVHTSPYALAALTWSIDGRYGAGTGDPAALFHFWREADDAQLCGPPSDNSTAPALASLGMLGPPEGQSVTSADGTVTVTNPFVIHDHASNYDALSVTDTFSSTLLRQFGAAFQGTMPIAISNPDGAQLYTQSGADDAVWCR